MTVRIAGLGTRITEAIHDAAGFRIKCQECKAYLRSLNRMATPDDAATIVARILPGIGLPAKLRHELGGIKEQRVWLMVIVEMVISES